MALELLMKAATVTVCHSQTTDLAAARGRGGASWSPRSASRTSCRATGSARAPSCIDVGINRLPDGKLVGDVQYEEAAERAGWITPVPGGVGPMTIAVLMKNTLESCQRADDAARLSMPASRDAA